MEASTPGPGPSLHQERHERLFPWAAAAAGLATLVFLLWMIFLFGGARLTDAVDDLGELVAALVAAAACGLTAVRVSSDRRCWWWLGASALAWGAGEAAWSWYDLVLHVTVPFPSYADIGFLSAVPLAVVGLLLFPSSSSRAAARVQSVLDGTIIAGSLIFASWATILGPLYHSHRGGILKQTVSLAYPASDVVMVALVIILFARSGPRGRTSLLLVMAGIVCFAVSDSSFSYLTEVNSYGMGSFLDTGWVAGYLLIGLGALRSVYAPAVQATETRASALSVVTPYVPVLAVLAVTAVELLTGHHMETVSWIMAFALVLLVLGRHVLILLDQAASRRHPEDGDFDQAGPPTGSDGRRVLVGH